MTGEDSASALELIRENIATFGHHIYLITGGPLPRFVYTIGLSQAAGAELVVAGASAYTTKELTGVITDVSRRLSSVSPEVWPSLVFEFDLLGSFSLRTVDQSWVRSLLLGALDFYGVDELPALQIVPDDTHRTIDVPALDKAWDAESEPVWKWIQEPWQYPISPGSTAVTNLLALYGNAITEVVRWEADEWEMFSGAGPDVSGEDVRVVSLGTLLAADVSLDIVTTLEVGQGLWRDPDDLRWYSWTRKRKI